VNLHYKKLLNWFQARAIRVFFPEEEDQKVRLALQFLHSILKGDKERLLMRKIFLNSVALSLAGFLFTAALKQLNSTPIMVMWIVIAAVFSSINLPFFCLTIQQREELDNMVRQSLADSLNRKVAKVEPSQLDKVCKEHNTLQQKLTEDLAHALGSVIPVAIKDSIIAVFWVMSVLVLFGWKSFLILVIFGIVPMVILVPRTSKSLKGLSDKIWEKVKQLQGINSNYYSHLRLLQDTGTTRNEIVRHDEVSGELSKLYTENAKKRMALHSAPRTVCQFLCVLSVLYVTVIFEKGSVVDGILATTCVVSTFLSLTFVLEQVFAVTEQKGKLVQLADILSLPSRPSGSWSVQDIGAIKVTNLKVVYPDGTSLFSEGLSFTLKAGESAVLVGSSGCGKSTFLEVLSRRGTGVWSGSIELLTEEGWVPLLETSLEKFACALISVPQDTDLFWERSVEENVGMRVPSKLSNQRKALIAEALEAVGLEGFEEKVAADLSGGQKKRVQAASALVGMLIATLEGRRTVLVLDEAASSLDSLTARQFVVNIESIRKKNGGITIWASHADALNPSWATALVFRSDGKGLIEQGRVSDLRMKENSAYAQVLMSPKL
jgi:ABC-type bacteriocin/lantibiotic exporter with double-glycine peptidase domain